MSRYMEAALQEAAKCWCDKETESKEMDVMLATAVAKRLAAWMDTAGMMLRTAVFYHELLDQCAEHLGSEAYTADDGTVRDTPIHSKIPELVAELVRKEKQ